MDEVRFYSACAAVLISLGLLLAASARFANEMDTYSGADFSRATGFAVSLIPLLAACFIVLVSQLALLSESAVPVVLLALHLLGCAWLTDVARPDSLVALSFAFYATLLIICGIVETIVARLYRRHKRKTSIRVGRG